MLLPLVFLGCASVSLQSAKDASFSNPIHKLFIILNNGQVDTIDPAYTPYLVAALKDEFTQKGVDIEIRIVNPLTLNDDVYRAEIASYQPEGVLTIIANGGITGPHGGMAKILYDVSLFDAGKNKRIWRARIDASGQTDVREKRMKMMAQNLVKRLSEDNLISSEPRRTGLTL
jgi:hypothetical protein